jgi:hypothetical protein
MTTSIGIRLPRSMLRVRKRSGPPGRSRDSSRTLQRYIVVCMKLSLIIAPISDKRMITVIGNVGARGLDFAIQPCAFSSQSGRPRSKISFVRAHGGLSCPSQATLCGEKLILEHFTCSQPSSTVFAPNSQCISILAS